MDGQEQAKAYGKMLMSWPKIVGQQILGSA